MTFGTSPIADVRAEAIEDLGLDGTRVRLIAQGGAVGLQVPLARPRQPVECARGDGRGPELGVPLPEIAARAATSQPAPHRGAVLRLAQGVTVVDDSYNSSPTALQRALEVVAREPRATRKAAVLGEMLELGEHSIRLHEECGRAAAAAGLDRLIAVGGEPHRRWRTRRSPADCRMTR